MSNNNGTIDNCKVDNKINSDVFCSTAESAIETNNTNSDNYSHLSNTEEFQKTGNPDAISSAQATENKSEDDQQKDGQQEETQQKNKEKIKRIANFFNLTDEATKALYGYCENLGLLNSSDEEIKKITKHLILEGELKFKPTLQNKVLKELLKQVECIDIDKLAMESGAECNDRGKISLKDKQVVVIEQILYIAMFKSCGLCRNLDFFYSYDGSFWFLLEVEELKNFLGLAAEKMGIQAIKARRHDFREQLFKQFITAAVFPKPEKSKEKVYVNLNNGTLAVTIDGAELQPYDRNDFLTYKLPFNYNPTAKAPLFMQYLNRVLPDEADKSKQMILAEYLGYVFVPCSTLKLEKTLLLYGSGANGKSVFYEVVRALFGSQNTSEYSLQSLTNDNGYYRAMLANKLVNYASEINGKLETSIFKQLVSGEPVEARLPYGQPLIITDYAKLIFNCNELPKDVEQTVAYFRRFIIITFDVTIPEHEQDKQLAHKIIFTELSGVLNWVLDGLNRLLQNKRFTDCAAAQQALEKYKIESDSVKLFLQEREYKPDLLTSTPKTIKDLYTDYKIFCEEDGYRPVSKINFKKRLKSYGVFVERRTTGFVALISAKDNGYTEGYKKMFC
ncbi:MAG: phage/plasmid primase, P4 family [Candidatus Falkowbacteria bacterium]